jgi:hypothetical protein
LRTDFSKKYPHNPRGAEYPAPITLRDHPAANNPVLTGSDVDTVNATGVADPFIVYDDQRTNNWYMFFEIIKDDGTIAIGSAKAITDPISSWNFNEVTIPSSDRQHSHPKVFREDGKWWMTPSPGSGEPNNYAIYGASDSDFPNTWTLEYEPSDLQGKVELDPNPFYYDGTWYITFEDGGGDQRLYYADDFRDDSWTEHSASPNPFTSGRISGNHIVTDNWVVVPRRRNSNEVRAEIWQIDESSLTAQEANDGRPVVESSPAEDWRVNNMHHYDPVLGTAAGNGFAAVDGKSSSNNWAIGIYAFGEHKPRYDKATIHDRRVEQLAAKGYADSNASSDGNPSPIPLDGTAGSDPGFTIDSSNNDITVPFDGWYTVIGKARYTQSIPDGTNIQMEVQVNGNRRELADENVGGSNNQTIRAVADLKLSAGDSVKALISQDSGSAVDLTTGEESFTHLSVRHQG